MFDRVRDKILIFITLLMEFLRQLQVSQIVVYQWRFILLIILISSSSEGENFGISSRKLKELKVKKKLEFS